MNALIIVTVALTGPIHATDMESSQDHRTVTKTIHQEAYASFEGPLTALSLGSGDSLGCEIYNVELVARFKSPEQRSIALAD